MNSETSNKLGFQKKYILSWLITGVVFSIFTFVFGYLFANPRPELNSQGITTILFAPFAMVIIGFGCFFIEGTFVKKFRFSEVEHPQWFWHIYPVSFIWMICIAMFLGFLISLFTSKDR